MNPIVEIKFRNISREILKELETKINSEIVLEIHEDTSDHIDPPAEIVILINEPLTEILANDSAKLLSNSLWDGLKVLWRKIKKENSIELNLKVSENRTIEFDLVGNVNPNDIDVIVEQMVLYLKNAEQQKIDFANPDYKQQEDVSPRLRLRHNPLTTQLEVVNFTSVKKQIAEAFKRVSAKSKGE